MIRAAALALSLCLAGSAPAWAASSAPSDPAAIDRAVRAAMATTGARGLALATVEDGRVAWVHAWGYRNASGEALTTDTVMYGASLTKTVFAYMVMQLVDEGVVDLDRPIATDFPQPLTAYGDQATRDAYSDWTALDDRWRRLTPRILLTHASGFANFAWLEPDHRLRFHFDPGSRYAYSGDGIELMQFDIDRGHGLSTGDEVQRRVFDRFGMARSSLVWRADFAGDLADGWDAEGKVEAHDDRSRVRAAGSMDTTIADMARFAAGLVRGDGLSAAARAEMLKASLPITTATQFPTFQPELPPGRRRPDLAAGIGLVVFDGPQGPGFVKGGHNDVTANTMVCIQRGRRCVVILSNDVRAEAAFPALVRAALGETGVPYEWEYGPQAR